MISNANEYTYANVQVLKIMEMLENNKEFDEVKRLNPSDIVNLAINILKLIIDIHDTNVETDEKDVKLLKDIIDDNGAFAYYSILSFACSNVDNDHLNKVLLKASETYELQRISDKLNAGDDV